MRTAQRIHDHDRRARRRQHLHFFQYRAFTHASLPPVRYGACFVSLFHDAGRVHRVLSRAAGKGGSAFETFTAGLIAHGGHLHSISAVSMGLSEA